MAQAALGWSQKRRHLVSHAPVSPDASGAVNLTAEKSSH